MTQRRHRPLLLVSLICALFYGGDGLCAETVVRLKAGTAIDHEHLLLADIAEIDCEDAQLAQKLRQAQVARLALPGQTRLIYPGQVEASLHRLGLLADQVRLDAAGPVKVTRNYTQISEDELQSAIRQYIDQHAPWDQKQMKVGQISCPREVRIPKGKVDLRIAPSRHTDWLGQVMFQVRIHVDGEPVRKISAAASIQVWHKVVLTAKPLARGEPISLDDLKMVSMDLAKAPVSAILDPGDALGGFAAKAVTANTILRKDLIRIPPLVRKGDVVRVVARSGGLTVSTNGLAKEDGARGERIRLINLRSSKYIYAEVLDAGTVQVDF